MKNECDAASSAPRLFQNGLEATVLHGNEEIACRVHGTEMLDVGCRMGKRSVAGGRSRQQEQDAGVR